MEIAMKLISSAMLSLLAGAALLIAAPAMARVDVDINVGVPGAYVAPSPYGPPPRYIAPPPRYIAPPPVYGAPSYGYVQPGTVYVQPGPVYVQPRPLYRDEWRERHWHDHRYGPRWDRDGDGVPNRHDRRPDNPWRY
jgi:hypothetical protein